MDTHECQFYTGSKVVTRVLASLYEDAFFIFEEEWQ